LGAKIVTPTVFDCKQWRPTCAQSLKVEEINQMYLIWKLFRLFWVCISLLNSFTVFHKATIEFWRNKSRKSCFQCYFCWI